MNPRDVLADRMAKWAGEANCYGYADRLVADLDAAGFDIVRKQERAVQRLHLERDEDVSGVSGTGVVAYGAAFPDDTIVLRWDTAVRSTVFYDNPADLMTIVGHGGRTRIVWDDEP